MSKIFRRFAARFSYKNLAAIYVAKNAKRRPKKEEESGVAAKPATGGDIGTAKPVPPPKKKNGCKASRSFQDATAKRMFFGLLKRKHRPFFDDAERQAVARLLFKQMATDMPLTDRELLRTAFNKLVDDGHFTVTLGDISNYERVIAEEFWRR